MYFGVFLSSILLPFVFVVVVHVQKIVATPFVIEDIYLFPTLYSQSNDNNYNYRDRTSTKNQGTRICVEIPGKKFRYKGKNNRTCEWVATKNLASKCKKKKIRKRCPLTCQVKKCSNNNSSSIPPSSMPSTMSTTMNNIDENNNNDESVFQGKKGICMTLREEGRKGSYIENLPKVQAINPYWMYSWGAKPADGVPSPPSYPTDGPRRIPPGDNESSSNINIDFFPMLWGYYANRIEQSLEEIRIQNQRVIFGFNEPDKAKQANISVETAINAWPQLESVAVENDRKTLLISPSCANPLGPWFEAFMTQVDTMELRVDAIGVHHYGGTNFPAFCEKMTTIYEKYNYRPLVLTEFAVADWQATALKSNQHTPNKVLEFMEQALEWMEQPEQYWILGYAWFSFDINNQHGTSSALFNNNGGLTPLGRFYSSFK